MMKKSLLVVLALVLSACASLRSETQTTKGPAPASLEAPHSVGELEPSSEIDKIIAETNPLLTEMLMGDGSDKVPLQIPLEINRKVAQWINFFAVRERERTQRYLERGEALRPHIESLLKDNDVPTELYYLAMIESGFVSHAKSRAKAVGVWQFMKGTGINYGLEVSSTVDERRNWVKATEAAASYLKDLNNVFGSWYLALAAYNAGEHRIVRSIMKGKTRDFWALAEAGLLPKETLNYVPKFLAAQIVGKNHKKYGFNIKVDPQDAWEEYDIVSVPAGVRLQDIAKVTGVSHDAIKRWNQDLLRGVTPHGRNGSVDIYVPKAHVVKIEENRLAMERLPKVRGGGEVRSYASRGTKSNDSIDYSVYVVKRGDTLSSISRSLGVSTRTLMKMNGLRRSRIHAGQRLKYYQSTNTSAVGGTKSANSRTLASDGPRKKR